MASDDRIHDLFLLLTLAPLAAGCPGDDTSVSDTNDPTTNNPTTNNPTTETPTTDSSSGPDDMSTTIAETASTGPGPEVTTTGVDSGSDDTTTGSECGEAPPLMGEIDPACTTYFELIQMCYTDVSPECAEIYAAYCQYTIEYSNMMYGEDCGMAYVDLYVCLSALTCEEFMDKTEDCAEQSMALDTACAAK